MKYWYCTAQFFVKITKPDSPEFLLKHAIITVSFCFESSVNGFPFSIAKGRAKMHAMVELDKQTKKNNLLLEDQGIHIINQYPIDKEECERWNEPVTTIQKYELP